MIQSLKIAFISFGFLFLLTSTQSNGQRGLSKNQGASEKLKTLKQAIEKVLKETGTPGAGVALVYGDSTVWASGLGKASVEKNLAATENTMFRIGSVSKMYVSLAILKLQQEGRISLKDTVRDWVPEIEFTNPWEKTSPVLVEHLLEHTTGWDDLHLADYALNDPKLTLKQALDFMPHSRTSRWMPGTRMAYCNSGPPVAAYIIETITGDSFEAYIQKHFFNPMGMENMTYFSSVAYKSLGATLYNGKKPQKYWNISVRPSGAINASPKDMTKMLKFFVNRGRVNGVQLISEASLRRMETPVSNSGAGAGLQIGYGLSNYSSPHKSFIYRSHGGGVNGGLTDFSYLPDHKMGYAVMINSANGDALYRISTLIRDFQTSGLPAHKTTSKGKKIAHPNNINGYYIAINPRVQLTYYLERILNIRHIWSNKDFLFSSGLLGGQTQTYRALHEKQYISQETGKISLVQVTDPLAGDVIHADSSVLRRVSPLIVFGQLILTGAWLLYMAGSIILGSIWFVRYWKGKTFSKNSVSIGLWPYVTSMLVLTEIVLSMIGGNDPFELLGKMSFVSVSIMVITILFAIFSLGSFINIILKWRANVNRKIYWHLAVLSCLHLLATSYFLWFGVIGIKTWT